MRLQRLFGIICALLICVDATSGAQAQADKRPEGLLWNRTGLPAVFPLQVKTPPGRDYLLTLRDAQTGAPALAAYIRGGAFFRVLVPPGSYRLHFATGDRWQGIDDGFGPTRTKVFDLPRPLLFETRGRGHKAGHIVTLPDPGADGMARATIEDQIICQSRQSVFAAPDYLSPERPADAPPPEMGPRQNAREFHRALRFPRNDTRSRYCR